MCFYHKKELYLQIEELEWYFACFSVRCKKWVLNENEIEKLAIKMLIYLMLLEEYIISLVMIMK